jgi:hypothetical protein
MIGANNKKDIPLYISTFTQDNRTEMEEAYKENLVSPFFREKSISLVNIKKLPAEVGETAAFVSPREVPDLATTEVYYAELNIRVDKEQKWLYNGINHRVIVVTKENGKWKIVRVSVPQISYILEKGYGFGTKDELITEHIAETMEKTGLVLDNQGKVIERVSSSSGNR